MTGSEAGIRDILFDSSRAAADMAVEVIMQRPQMFDEAYALCMGQEGKMAMRAARVVQLVAEQMPELMEPHFQDLVSRLPEITHSGVRRSMLKLLSFYDLSDDEALHSIIIDVCFSRMNDFGEEVAIRAYAMQVLKRFTKIYPEITGEFIAAIHLLIDNAQDTLSNYAARMLKELYREAAP